MYNQISIKPQDEGSMQEFPLGSVTIDGIIVSSDGYHNPNAESGEWMLQRNDQNIALKNPINPTKKSLKNGKYLYTVYCSACHGDSGESTDLGNMRGAPPIAIIIGSDPTFTQGYLFSKIKYGGVSIESMPGFGYSTTPKERWDIVNYVFSKWANAAN